MYTQGERSAPPMTTTTATPLCCCCCYRCASNATLFTHRRRPRLPRAMGTLYIYIPDTSLSPLLPAYNKDTPYDNATAPAASKERPSSVREFLKKLRLRPLRTPAAPLSRCVAVSMVLVPGRVWNVTPGRHRGDSSRRSDLPRRDLTSKRGI